MGISTHFRPCIAVPMSIVSRAINRIGAHRISLLPSSEANNMSQTALMEHNATGIPSGKLGMWGFLASEVMLFGAFISSYIVLRMGSPNFGVPTEEVLGRPLATLNTFVLITSSVTMVLALAAIQRDN